jgi:hypothetical protein
MAGAWIELVETVRDAREHGDLWGHLKAWGRVCVAGAALSARELVAVLWDSARTGDLRGHLAAWRRLVGDSALELDTVALAALSPGEGGLAQQVLSVAAGATNAQRQHVGE